MEMIARIFIGWEAFIEQAFVHYLCGYISGQDILSKRIRDRLRTMETQYLIPYFSCFRN